MSSNRPPKGNRAEVYDWHRQRIAEDMPMEPSHQGDRSAGLTAYMNWSDLRGFSENLKELFPDLVYFPTIYTGGGYGDTPPPEAVVPIYRDFLECARDPNHGNVVVVAIRWPWADEKDSNNPDVLAGRIYGAQSPWLDPPWALPTPWARSRRIGRRVNISVYFKGYLRVQDIKVWDGGPYWGSRSLADGRQLSESIPDSWVFNESGHCVLNAGYKRSNIDSAYFCEALLRLWRNHSTPHRALYNALTGDVITPHFTDDEVRYGWNALKRGIDGSRHYIFLGYNKEKDRFGVPGPIVKDIKKAISTPD